MAKIADAVFEKTTTTGTGNKTLTGAVSGHQSFSDAFGTGAGNPFFAKIGHQSAAEWEVGIYYMSSTTVMVPVSVLESSNAGAAVNFSAGSKDVTCDYPAAFQIGGDTPTLNADMLAAGFGIRNLDQLNLGLSTEAIASGSATPVLQVQGASLNASSIVLGRWSSDNLGPAWYFNKSRSGTIGTPGTVVADDDPVGTLWFMGDDGTDMANPAAMIRAEIDGTPGSNAMPGRLILGTNSGGASVTGRMRITADGGVSVGTSDISKGAGTLNAENGLYDQGYRVGEVLLAAVDVTTNPAQLVIALPTGFKNYRFCFYDINGRSTMTSSSYLIFRLADGVGPTAITTGSYDVFNIAISNTSPFTPDGDFSNNIGYFYSDLYFPINTTSVSYRTDVECVLFDPASGGSGHGVIVNGWAVENWNDNYCPGWGGCYEGGTAVTGFVIETYSGENFDDFSYRVYGQL